VKVIVTEADVALANVASPSFVAVTIQVPAPVAFSSPCASTAQPVAVPPITEYEIFPVPLPPDVESVTAVPTVADPPLRTRVACGERATPIVTTVVAVFVSESISTEAVIVNVAAAVMVSGVPEIVPVELSKTKPDGNEPLIAKVLVAPASAATVTVTGVIAIPTASVVVAVEIFSSGFVVNEAVVVDGPAPAALLATTSATYRVPGCNPFTVAFVVADVAVTGVPAITGESRSV
jgi:hypothetical protein